ncbi:hypothetical protein FRB97_000968 [Tulasnella sp. 331]|nr:hypothetical protein FRB97_000968 [Tulasnella sp. 331]
MLVAQRAFHRQLVLPMTAQRVTPAYFRAVVEPSDEVIEDSEPERVEARRVERLRRKAQKEIIEATTYKSHTLNGADVFQSHPSHILPQLDMGNTTTMQVMDENDLPLSGASTSVRECLPTIRSKSFAAEPITRPDVGESAFRNVQSTELLNLTRFACTSVARPSGLKRPASHTPSAVTNYSDIEVLPSDRSKSESTSDVKKSKVKRVKASVLGQADFDTSSILKCPACQVSWTARKSASAKMDHVRKCATKKGIGRDDLHRLLEEEAASNPSGLGLKKGKVKKAAIVQTALAPVRPEGQTYLEDIVEGAAPKKRKARQPMGMPVTVKPIADTRASILGRAKVLLTDFQLLEDGGLLSHEETVDTIQSDLPLDGREAAWPLATQQFTTSRLARAFTRPSSSSHTPDEMPEMEGPRAVSGSNGTADAFAYFAQYNSSPEKNILPQALASFASSSESSGAKLSARYKGKMRGSMIRINGSDGDTPGNNSPGPFRLSRPDLSPPSTPVKRRDAGSSTSLTAAFEQRLVILDGEGEEQFREPDDDDWSNTSGPNLAWDGNRTAGEHISPTGWALVEDNNPKPDIKFLRQWASRSPYGKPRSSEKSDSESSILLLRRRKNATNKPRADSPSSIQNATTPKRRKASVADPSTANASKMSDRNLFDHFRKIIYQDEVLHCRILRYEA